MIRTDKKVSDNALLDVNHFAIAQRRIAMHAHHSVAKM